MQVICVGYLSDIKEFTKFVSKWFGKNFPIMHADINLYNCRDTNEINAYVLDNLGIARKRNVNILIMTGIIEVKQLLVNLGMPFIDIFIKPEDLEETLDWWKEPYKKCCEFGSSDKNILKIPIERDEPLANYFDVSTCQFSEKRNVLSVCEVITGIDNDHDLVIFNEFATSKIKSIRTYQMENGLGDKSKILFNSIYEGESLKLEYLSKK